MARRRTVEVEVDIDLDNWDDEELQQEMIDRGYCCFLPAESSPTEASTFAQRIYESWNSNPTPIIKDFIYRFYGRVI
jgi:hypothetical protein